MTSCMISSDLHVFTCPLGLTLINFPSSSMYDSLILLILLRYSLVTFGESSFPCVKTCGKLRKCWTNSSSRECCKRSSTYLCGSSATFDVRKLVVRQVEANDGHDLLDTSLVLLQHFGIHIGRWSFFVSVYNIPNIHGCQQ